MAHPDHAHWQQSWRDKQIPFHLRHVHPLLVRCWANLGLASDARVFVPLCGKSLDIMWLHNRGHHVAGVELSPIAVREFFKAARLQPKRKTNGDFTEWTQERLAIFCGDFFALTSGDLQGVRAVYDRAALTALPENLRDLYVAHLHAIVPADCQILLLTVEDLDDGEAASDNMDRSEEIASLYRDFFTLELLHAEYHEAAAGRPGEPTDPRCVHKAYRLQRS